VRRRDFVRHCAVAGAGAALAGWPGSIVLGRPPSRRARRGPPPDHRLASFWEPLAGGKVRCTTCPNFCVRAEGGVTFCNTRVNRGGKLYTLTYGRPCVLYEDPLEKNPLYHVAPGTQALGTATAGCNLRCAYCQNWDIAMVGPQQTRNMALSPEQLVASMKQRGLRWLSFSYTEPTAYYEYAVDAAKLAKRNGLHVAVVTAGFINPDPLALLIRHADAFSITLKASTEPVYRELCGARLATVLQTIRTVARSACWLEVVALIVPGKNDSDRDLRATARTVRRIGADIPLHFLRFSPAYKLKHLPKTPVPTLERAHAIAKAEGVNYAYLSNLPGHRAANTYCPGCNRLLIERIGFKILANRIRAGKCPGCKRRIPGLQLG